MPKVCEHTSNIYVLSKSLQKRCGCRFAPRVLRIPIISHCFSKEAFTRCWRSLVQSFQSGALVRCVTCLGGFTIQFHNKTYLFYSCKCYKCFVTMVFNVQQRNLWMCPYISAHVFKSVHFLLINLENLET